MTNHLSNVTRCLVYQDTSKTAYWYPGICCLFASPSRRCSSCSVCTSTKRCHELSPGTTDELGSQRNEAQSRERPTSNAACCKSYGASARRKSTSVLPPGSRV